MLSFQNFSKSYNNVPVLVVPVLHIPQGIHWIKGANGSGKTTFFKSLAGIIPAAGDVFLDDTISLRSDPVTFRQRVNYSEAEPVYPDFLTAKDLIRFIGKTKGSNNAQQTKLLQQLGIDAFFEKPCKTYSSGMLKKVSIALAFLGSPKVIILDEPLITLDTNARNVLFHLIHESVMEYHTTFLISSHQSIEERIVKITRTFCIENKTIVPA